MHRKLNLAFELVVLLLLIFGQGFGLAAVGVGLLSFAIGEGVAGFVLAHLGAGLFDVSYSLGRLFDDET